MRVLTLFEVPVVTLFEADFPFRFPRAVVRIGKRKWERDGLQSPGRMNPGSSAVVRRRWRVDSRRRCVRDGLSRSRR
jgi:hypothetical protein